MKLRDALNEESTAAAAAHKLGLVSKGRGRWAIPDGPIVAKTVNGKLKKIDDGDEEGEEEESSVSKVVGLYPGRFQPFGAHHKKAYEWLTGKFGGDTFVVTSNFTGDKSPFNFKEKKKIINSHGISKVKQVRDPYKAKEVVSKYNPNTTAVVFGFSDKDAGRIKSSPSSYLQPYEDNKDNLKPYSQNGYFIVIPKFNVKMPPGFGEMSGTTLRKAFGSDKLSSKKKQQLFKSVFGHNKKDIYDLVTNKLREK